MTWGELERKIKKAGWKLDFHGGEHDQYYHPNIPGVYLQIGRHKKKEVATGTCNAILKQAGLK